MRRAETPLRIDVSVSFKHPTARRALPEAGRSIRQAAAAALRAAGFAADRGVELSVVVADDALVRRLNRAHRGIDRPTNVLAFAGETSPPKVADGPPVLLGDVVLGFETVVREAAMCGESLEDHLCHLVVHGVLHLAGHDHDSPVTARAMEDLERRALAQIGIADPHADARADAEAV